MFDLQMEGKHVDNVTFLVNGHLQRETMTGDLRSRVFGVDVAFNFVDGDGSMHAIPAGAVVVVIEIPVADYQRGTKYLDAAELYMHGQWGNRPRGERTATPFDIRTAKGGRRPGAEDTPF